MSGRKRATDRHYSAEDQALDQISKEAEERIQARRQARTEAREMRMKEIERQQKEEEEKLKATSQGIDSVKSLSSYSGSRRGSNDSTGSDVSSKDSNDPKDQVRKFKNQFRELEDKYKAAMLTNAQLDNVKTSNIFQLELLKEQLEEQAEAMLEVQREYRDKNREFDLLKRDFESMKLDSEGMKMQIELKDKLLKESGLVIVQSNEGEFSLKKCSDMSNLTVTDLGTAIISEEAADLLKRAGDGSLGNVLDRYGSGEVVSLENEPVSVRSVFSEAVQQDIEIVPGDSIAFVNVEDIGSEADMVKTHGPSDLTDGTEHTKLDIKKIGDDVESTEFNINKIVDEVKNKVDSGSDSENEEFHETVSEFAECEREVELAEQVNIDGAESQENPRDGYKDFNEGELGHADLIVKFENIGTHSVSCNELEDEMEQIADDPSEESEKALDAEGDMVKPMTDSNKEEERTDGAAELNVIVTLGEKNEGGPLLDTADSFASFEFRPEIQALNLTSDRTFSSDFISLENEIPYHSESASEDIDLFDLDTGMTGSNDNNMKGDLPINAGINHDLIIAQVAASSFEAEEARDGACSSETSNTAADGHNAEQQNDSNLELSEKSDFSIYASTNLKTQDAFEDVFMSMPENTTIIGMEDRNEDLHKFVENYVKDLVLKSLMIYNKEVSDEKVTMRKSSSKSDGTINIRVPKTRHSLELVRKASSFFTEELAAGNVEVLHSGVINSTKPDTEGVNYFVYKLETDADVVLISIDEEKNPLESGLEDEHSAKLAPVSGYGIYYTGNADNSALNSDAESDDDEDGIINDRTLAETLGVEGGEIDQDVLASLGFNSSDFLGMPEFVPMRVVTDTDIEKEEKQATEVNENLQSKDTDDPVSKSHESCPRVPESENKSDGDSEVENMNVEIGFKENVVKVSQKDGDKSEIENVATEVGDRQKMDDVIQEPLHSDEMCQSDMTGNEMGNKDAVEVTETQYEHKVVTHETTFGTGIEVCAPDIAIEQQGIVETLIKDSEANEEGSCEQVLEQNLPVDTDSNYGLKEHAMLDKEADGSITEADDCVKNEELNLHDYKTENSGDHDKTEEENSSAATNEKSDTENKKAVDDFTRAEGNLVTDANDDSEITHGRKDSESNTAADEEVVLQEGYKRRPVREPSMEESEIGEEYDMDDILEVMADIDEKFEKDDSRDASKIDKTTRDIDEKDKSGNECPAEMHKEEKELKGFEDGATGVKHTDDEENVRKIASDFPSSDGSETGAVVDRGSVDKRKSKKKAGKKEKEECLVS